MPQFNSHNTNIIQLLIKNIITTMEEPQVINNKAVMPMLVLTIMEDTPQEGGRLPDQIMAMVGMLIMALQEDTMVLHNPNKYPLLQ